MLPLALAGSGGFTTESVSMHAKTNAEVIQRFLPVRVQFDERNGVQTCVVTKR